MAKTVIERAVYEEINKEEFLAARILPSGEAGYLTLILSPKVADTKTLEDVEVTLSKECATALAEALLNTVREIA